MICAGLFGFWQMQQPELYPKMICTGLFVFLQMQQPELNPIP